MRCSVIIPTLNEEQNIGPLIRRIYSVLGTDGVQVIVVDDDSTDKTQRVVRQLAERFPGTRLIVRHGQRGLSSAVRLGAEQVRDGAVVVMDADLSHDPRFIPAMLSLLDRGYDVVVGSRYVPGGEVRGWPGSRLAVSRFATVLARLLLQVPLRDPMSGFVAFRSARLLLDNVRHANYKFLLEVVAQNRHLRVAEVPIVFTDRRYGESKLGGTTIFSFLLLVVKLLFRRRR